MRYTITDGCIESVWVDVNDPTLTLNGRVFGTNDGIDSDYSRWLVFVNDEVVSNEAMTLGSFSHQWPIGAYLQPGSRVLPSQFEHGLRGTPTERRVIRLSR